MGKPGGLKMLGGRGKNFLEGGGGGGPKRSPTTICILSYAFGKQSPKTTCTTSDAFERQSQILVTRKKAKELHCF